MNDQITCKRKEQITLGFCPIGKFVFSHEDAMRMKKELEAWMKESGVSYIGIDGLIEDGMIRSDDHVESVVRFFKNREVDALLIPHCNFGTESAASMIAKNLGLPTLLWSPRDARPLEDGSRLRDSLCGTLATSKVLNKLKVPFTYIPNCALADESFIQGFTDFLRVAQTVKTFRTMKIAQIGINIDFFWTTIINRSDLLSRFGIQVKPFDMIEFIDRIQSRMNRNERTYAKEIDQMKSKWLDDQAVVNKKELLYGPAMRDVMRDMANDEGFHAFSVQSFDSLQNALGAGAGLGTALIEETTPVASESDIHGAIGSALIEAACGYEKPSFFPEFTIRHPKDDQSVLLWHASAPISLRHQTAQRVPFRAPWILKSLPPTSLQFRLQDGKITVLRFDGEGSDYRLGVGKGHIKEGPITREVYAWMQVDDWTAWEQKLIRGPYIHHCSCIYGNVAHILKEACRYMDGVTYEAFHDEKNV